MTSFIFSLRARRTAVALAVGTACLAAQAQDASVETTVSVGAGAIDGSKADRAIFGQYNGLRDNSVVGLLGVDYSLRNPETSAWVEFQGANLLGDTRELGLVWKKPGNWKFTADYGELVRYEPNTINTGLLGAGSSTPQVVAIAAGTGNDLNLKTKRAGLGLGFTKIISPALQLQVDVKSENKTGARPFGAFMNCLASTSSTCLAVPGLAVLMLPEPIDANHSQVEARLSYAMEKLRVSVGYYGSFYRNANSTLNPSGPFTGVADPMLALPPDNQAHHWDLSGNYDFTTSTRGTFKLGYTTASQDAGFVSAGPAANLGAKVNTTLAKVGLTSRPMPKLSLLADLRYENKDDQTPLANYNSVGTNRQLSSEKTLGKLQANWQFNSDYRGTLGADYEFIDRGVFTPSSVLSSMVPLRQKTVEGGIRAELRRRMADDLSGAISVSSSQRDGSNWLQGNPGVPGVTKVFYPASSFDLTQTVFMPTLADRQRDKIKLFADWQANEKLSLQFSAEEGRDKFSTPSAYGLQSTRMNQLGVDWGYAVNYNWALNGYLSRSGQTLNQARYAGSVMAFDNTNLAASIGVTGKATSKVHVGGSLTYVDDKSVYAQTLTASAPPTLLAGGGLPDIVYRQTALKLFANYALEKGSSVRLDFVHQHVSANDWAWGNNGTQFAYSDGSTVAQSQDQNVSFIGITYIYKLP
ncbi:MAG: MtrB/PioB family decaheme-associated outer membrane protein [Gammaproteobacteria bacterium]|uniref:MtrB/PioB family decaheme-associated outer membrane protein n=1 Tax=Rhodoferax sp. TaxID=50421 RepID=UPI0017EF8F46|nr:MtrB/PioB family decaheme-associated outer membrane protein [Rhodoferax sp.]MBU3900708.1 MtrB/PioB family decaheme-associated outer membrane protein [Gammaproteobacteria bacterium]MBA3056898.1 MtrB/PioB family decaheme-associated outer membrane protein [Rhodoferax sp.]MBU3997214.1 MtrB/PioB family decaheme-associated outer membrane protein [Gammaproteobacteria bacterium]MBU4079459.1 MtrB/PioB family decaheme-associated outer membrane protein [Gammaproteobacteria bacterium]MBU4115114.1 MtrB/